MTAPSAMPAMKLANTCTPDEAIQFWIMGRKVKPGPDAVRTKLARITEFLAWLASQGRHVHDNLCAVTGDDLQDYKMHLVRTLGDGIARDRLAHVTKLFNDAAANRKFNGLPSPAKGLVLPHKPDGKPRPAFDDSEAETLMRAAEGQTDPVILWGTRLGSLGLITSEWADANVRDVEPVDGVPCMWVRVVNRKAGAAHLKTTARGRCMPLPTIWVDRFLAYVSAIRREYGERAPLFPQIPPDRDGRRNGRASVIIMDFIRSCGIENEKDPETGVVIKLKDSYSWRHRLISALETIAFVNHPITGEQIANKHNRQLYLSGHASSAINGKVYAEHPPRETLHIINTVPDPLGRKVAHSVAA
jgi:hypothetical protein